MIALEFYILIKKNQLVGPFRTGSLKKSEESFLWNCLMRRGKQLAVFCLSFEIKNCELRTCWTGCNVIYWRSRDTFKIPFFLSIRLNSFFLNYKPVSAFHWEFIWVEGPCSGRWDFKETPNNFLDCITLWPGGWVTLVSSSPGWQITAWIYVILVSDFLKWLQ